MMTALSSFSQETYPKKIVYKKDTLVAITIAQSRKINLMYLETRHCATIRGDLGRKIVLLTTKSANQDSIIVNLRAIIDSEKLRADNNKLEASKAVAQLEDTDAKYKKDKVKVTFRGVVIGVVVGIILSALIK